MARKNKKNRRPRNALVDILNGFLSLIVIGILVTIGVLAWGAQRFNADGPLTEATTFQVERGNGLATISQKLATAGIVQNRWIFQAGTLAMKKERAIKAGEYRLDAGLSMSEVLMELSEGTPITYAVTIPEGFTSWQVVERVRANTTLVGEIDALPPEGSLLPNTYSFERGDKRADIIARMQKAHDEALAEIWAARNTDIPIKNPEELVVLASIVEKETGVGTERPEVAAVFVNRLNRGIRLQSDPTIIYGITKGEGALARGLRRSEIEKKTDYNTYQIDGLPPTPISNPGLEAMRAVANPATTKALYFVAAGAVPSDGHLFAETYAEHRRNVAKWRAIEKQVAEDAAREAEDAREALEAEAAKKAEDSGS